VKLGGGGEREQRTIKFTLQNNSGKKFPVPLTGIKILAIKPWSIISVGNVIFPMGLYIYIYIYKMNPFKYVCNLDVIS
jgi:hypothetical protein